MPNPRTVARPATAYELLQLSYGASLELFHTLPAPTAEEMNGEYRAEVLDLGRPVYLWLASVAVHLKGRWLAKAFTPEGPAGGRGYNVFVIGERVVRGTRMRTSIGPSRHDGQPSFHLDYSADNSGPLGTMRDEIRRLTDGLYLGLGIAGYADWMRRPNPFLLEGPAAPFRD